MTTAEFDNKVLVNKIISQANKFMVKDSLLAMSEASLKDTLKTILDLNEIIDLMRNLDDEKYDSDILMLSNVVETYESSIDKLKQNVADEQKLANKYSSELEYMITQLKNNISKG